MKPTKKVIIGLCVLILASLVFGVYGNVREGFGSSYKSSPNAPKNDSSSSSSSDSSLKGPIIIMIVFGVVAIVGIMVTLYYQMSKNSNNTSVDGNPA
jgi:FtsZ-interacting cell division protein ZipA